MRAQNQMLLPRVTSARLLLASAFFAVSPAAADDWKTCADSYSGDDVTIAACTRAIDSGQYTAQDLATLYTSRGLAYWGKGQRDRYSQDFDQVLRVDPRFAQGDQTSPVDVGDGRYIFCCRAIVLDCRIKATWRFRDTQGSSDEQCIQACWRNVMSNGKY